MSSGRASNTVWRPSGSRAVVTTPRGLWNSHRRVRSRVGSGSPSIVMRSLGVTLTAGESRRWPFRVTRPSAIIASASRREATPARAIALAMRSGSGSAATAGLAGAAPRVLEAWRSGEPADASSRPRRRCGAPVSSSLMSFMRA